MKGLNQAISIFKSRKAFADALGVTTMAVHNWESGKRKITPERAIEIESITGGKVQRHSLRPDIFPPVHV